ncbi:hypothetical protein D3C71_1888520 [compost metagenome]
MLARQLFDLRFLAVRYTRNNQILVRRDAKLAFMNLSNFQQTGFQRTAWIIQNTTVLDK